MDGASRECLPEDASCSGIQSDEPEIAPDVEDIVDNHRDRPRGCPQVHGPHEAAFGLARGIGHVTPLRNDSCPTWPTD